MEIKHILITGSTDGIGKLAAIELAKAGHHIYLHGRNPIKLENCIAEIKSNSGNPNIKGYQADFGDLKAVKQMGQNILQDNVPLNVLINNAGVFKSSNSSGDENLELRFIVNYLAPVSLTQSLLDTLRTQKQSRIINLSSAAQSSVDLGALEGHESISQQEAYAQSKLALLMWSFHLANTENSITTIALNPGSLLNTNMVREAYGRHWSPASKGADIIKRLAVTDLPVGRSGQYFDNDLGDWNKAHPDAYNEELISLLMSKTKALL